MKHPYTVGCACNRCEREKMHRNAQSKANQRPANQVSRKARQVRRQDALDRQAKWHYDNGDHDYSMNG